LAADSWRIILVTPGRRITAAILPLVSAELPTAQVIELQGYPKDGNLGDLGSSGAICFLDLISDPEDGVEALTRLVQGSPNVPVVALVPDSNPSLILQALRVGARDFLTEPFSPDQFRTVLDKLASILPHLTAGLGRIFTVIPAKGGCGASTLAFNLAVQLRKAGAERTLLADLDPMTGTQAFQMKLRPGFSFLEILNQGSGLDADIWRGVVQSYSGIDVLLAPDHPVDGAQEMGDTRPILEFSRRMYDAIVADMGCAYGEWTLSAARVSDEILLTATNELPSLQAAQRVMSYLDSNGIASQKIRLVVNRFNKDVGLSKEMIETAMQTSVYQLIPSDYDDAQQALLEGKPLQNTSTIGKPIAKMAANLIGKDVTENKNADKSKSPGALSGLFGLFSRST